MVESAIAQTDNNIWSRSHYSVVKSTNKFGSYFNFVYSTVRRYIFINMIRFLAVSFWRILSQKIEVRTEMSIPLYLLGCSNSFYQITGTCR